MSEIYKEMNMNSLRKKARVLHTRFIFLFRVNTLFVLLLIVSAAQADIPKGGGYSLPADRVATASEEFTFVTVPSLRDHNMIFENQKFSIQGVENPLPGKRVVAVSGGTAVIGVPDANHGEGSVYVLILNGTAWVQQATLSVQSAIKTGQFGASVAIDKDTIVVGSPYGEDHYGRAYVFKREGSVWHQQVELKARDTSAYDEFGGAVGISDNTMVVAAQAHEEGVAYVFTRKNKTWSEQVKLKASIPARSFGFAVAIDGNSIVVGEPFLERAGGDSGAGAVYIFIRSGSSWNEQARLVVNHNMGPMSVYNGLGFSVALSGNTLVAGDSLSRAAYVFERRGDVWKEPVILSGLDSKSDPNSSTAVAVVDDVIVVSENAATATGHGPVADVFTRNMGIWSYQTSMETTNLEPPASIAISGNTVIFGAVNPSKDTENSIIFGAVNPDNNAESTDLAYIFNLACDATFTLPNNQWRQVSLPCNPDGNKTVAKVFGDDGLGQFGVDWGVFAYDLATNGYINLDFDTALEQGKGYWIIQITGVDRVLDMPKNSTPTPSEFFPPCIGSARGGLGEQGCFIIGVEAPQAYSSPWRMIGYPFASIGLFNELELQGVNLQTAESRGIAWDRLWTYDGTRYKVVKSGGYLEPWTSYWLALIRRYDDNWFGGLFVYDTEHRSF
jgi:hypothetical protein